jgi:hypothetical protein
MKLTSRLLFVVCLFTIYTITIDARSVLQDSVDLLASSSLQEDESNFRHRLEHSPVLDSLRWSVRKFDKDELCEYCDFILPIVG